MELVKITTEYITLGQFLKFISIAGSGGDIKAILADEIVEVDGELETRRGRKLYPDMVVEIKDQGTYKVTR